MTNWQDEYKTYLLRMADNGKNDYFVYAEKMLLRKNIQQTDKRTRNGKMSVIFDRAKIFICDEVLTIFQSEQNEQAH